VRKLALVTFAGWALASTRPARANCAPEAHLSTCFDADTFWPHAGPTYFNFIGGRTTTPPGTFGLGLFATYLARPVVLVIPSADPRGAEVVAVDHLSDATLLFSFGLTERMEASLALPVAAYRSGSGISSLTSRRAQPISHAAMRDARAGAGFRLVGCPAAAGCEQPFGMAARFELSLPTGDESSFAGDRSVVAMPSLSGEWTAAPFVAGAEIGARIRSTADLAGSRVGPQLMLALGLGADVLEGGRLGFLVEATALPTLVAQRELTLDQATGERIESGSRPLLVPAEWEAAVRSADLLTDGMSLSLGAGTPLLLTGESGITSPRYRVTLSIRYTPGRRRQQDPP
jgi:OmpA-OmpF porin, OOP family